MNETTKILLLLSAYALLVVTALVIKIGSKVKNRLHKQNGTITHDRNMV